MKKFDQINVIPFIDIMLVLLAIVLTTATFIVQGKIQVNTPTSSTATALENTALESRLITADRDGGLYLDDQAVTFAALAEAVGQWEASQRVNLKLDADTPFALFVRIGDLLRQRQITQVNILALPEAH